MYVLIDLFATYYSGSLNSSNDCISPNIINSIQCISILIFSPIVAYKLNFKKIYNILYDIYREDSYENNEVQSENKYVSVDRNYQRIKKSDIRSGQRFEISSINFF